MLRFFLADVILIVHLCLVLFVVGVLLGVPVGSRLGWRWVRHRGLRRAHLAAIGFVAAETVLGIACPLTEWEAALRGVASEEGFVERLLHGVIFYDLPGWVFGAAYVGGAILALALWRWVPPRRAATGRSAREGSRSRPGRGAGY